MDTRTSRDAVASAARKMTNQQLAAKHQESVRAGNVTWQDAVLDEWQARDEDEGEQTAVRALTLNKWMHDLAGLQELADAEGWEA